MARACEISDFVRKVENLERKKKFLVKKWQGYSRVKFLILLEKLKISKKKFRTKNKKITRLYFVMKFLIFVRKVENLKKKKKFRPKMKKWQVYSLEKILILLEKLKISKKKKKNSDEKMARLEPHIASNYSLTFLFEFY